ncbi:MAG: hypothetical protein ACKV2T_06305 [Kofleriaceae bacterium]
MTPRHMVLVAAAVGVFGLGVYLYVAVNSTSTATANVYPRTPETKASPRQDEAPASNAPAKEAEPTQKTATVNSAIRDSVASTQAATVERPGANIDLKKDEMMATANKAYDQGDFDEAIVVAKKVLSNDPSNVRMLRIVVSASCILDDATTAQKSYLMLPIGGTDRADMKKRCDRYGVAFAES